MYGKIGAAQQLIGFENIQLMLGASTQVSTMTSDATKSHAAGFAVIEVPTGAGTTAEWLFEPQVGTNHWAFGFGVDLMIENENGFSFVFGGDFRHLIANWETRTFDLTNNGAWSRYLLIEQLSTLDLSPHIGLPAINILTQDALIQGRNQITMYGRLQKEFENCLFELSYNLFYNQAESISQVKNIPAGYGIYALDTAGGITTASTAEINQSITPQDSIATGPVQLLTSDLNLVSGAV